MDDETEPETGTPEWFRFALSHHTTKGRCSSCLIGQLVAGWKSRDLDFHGVANEIGFLEDHPTAIRANTKPAARFKKGRLRGLHHKHYFQSQFIIRNIGDYWFGPDRQVAPKLEKLIQKTMLDSEIDPDLKMKYILHKFVIGGLENRSREKALTGEWIIYKRHNNINYYLTLARHAEPEGRIVDRLKSCAADFPEIASSLGRL